jgi:hypothetical protein
MGAVRRGFSGVSALAVIGAVGLALVAMACAPPATTSGPPRTTTTTSTTSTLPWSTPTGQWTDFSMTCAVNVLGTYYTFPQDASVNVDAPSTVTAGQTFTATVAPGLFNVPTSVQGYALTGIKSFTIKFPLSPNVQFVDSVLSAGINMGPGYPSVTLSGTDLIYKVPGPLAPGAAVQMPKVRLTLKATGAPGSTIQTRLSSLSNTATFALGSVDDSCHLDDPNLVFWTTAIS